jgi:hypothetical protein
LADVSSDSSTWGFLYDLCAAVGPGCPNRKRDVQIVQFLLFRCLDAKHEDLTSKVGKHSLDGIMGPYTTRAIVAYQEDNAATCLLLDGRVDPGGYTIKRLMDDYATRYPGKLGEPWTFANCPKDLAEYWQGRAGMRPAPGSPER